MSGFILVPNSWKNSQKVHNAKQAFLNKSYKLTYQEKLLGNHLLICFDDLFSNTIKQYSGNNGNYLFYSGVLLFSGLTGIDALKAIEKKISNNHKLEKLEISGNYTLVVYFNNELFITNDLIGGNGCYSDKNRIWFTTNFISSAYLTDRFIINQQEYIERIFFGINFGRSTIIDDVETLDPTKVYQVGSHQNFDKSFVIPNLEFSRKKCLENSYEILKEEFETYKRCFPNGITTALSGGYDTRLIYSACRSIGIQPDLYVYGKNTDIDVVVAKNIASGEKVNIDHSNKSIPIDAKGDRLIPSIMENFWDHDGAGNLFSNKLDILLRIERSKTNSLVLNGWGGAIYRDIWSIDFKKKSIRELIRSFYDTGELSHFGINTNEFWDKIEEKVFKQVQKFGINNKVVSREDAERVFLIHRIKFNLPNTHINNYFGDAIMPYTNQKVAFNSMAIPFKFKKFGEFQSSLIKALDPKIASYQSEYGFNFFDGPTLSYKIKQYFKANINNNIKSKIKAVSKTSRKSPFVNGFAKESEFSHELIKKELFAKNELLGYRYIKNQSSIVNKNIIDSIYSIELLNKMMNK
jgi:asparagine synthase (glutamine-hydrolysing)